MIPCDQSLEHLAVVVRRGQEKNRTSNGQCWRCLRLTTLAAPAGMLGSMGAGRAPVASLPPGAATKHHKHGQQLLQNMGVGQRCLGVLVAMVFGMVGLDSKETVKKQSAVAMFFLGGGGGHG